MQKKQKIELSTTLQTRVNIPFISADASGLKHLDEPISRSKFESLADDLIQRTVKPCEEALKDAGLKAGEINDIILVGGMTRMPKVIETVKTFFERIRTEV